MSDTEQADTHYSEINYQRSHLDNVQRRITSIRHIVETHNVITIQSSRELQMRLQRLQEFNHSIDSAIGDHDYGWYEEDQDALMRSIIMDSDPIPQTSDSSMTIATDSSLSSTCDAVTVQSDTTSSDVAVSIPVPAPPPAAPFALIVDQDQESLELSMNFTDTEDEETEDAHSRNPHQQEPVPRGRRSQDRWYSPFEFVHDVCENWARGVPLADGVHDVHETISQFWGNRTQVLWLGSPPRPVTPPFACMEQGLFDVDSDDF